MVSVPASDSINKGAEEVVRELVAQDEVQENTSTLDDDEVEQEQELAPVQENSSLKGDLVHRKYATFDENEFDQLLLSRHATVLDELKSIRNAFREQMRTAGHGKDFFLEMALTRNLSLMPTRKDIHEVTEGFVQLTKRFSSILPHKEPSDESDATNIPLLPTSGNSYELPPTKKKGTPLSAYFTLLSAVVALSSIGPFLDRLDGVSPSLKIVWRTQGTAIVLFPLALQSVVSKGLPGLTRAQWCTFAMASASYCILTVCLSMSLEYTTVSNATILTNSQSLLLVIAKLLMGTNVVFLEGAGVVMATTGAVLCSRDSSATASLGSDPIPNAELWSIWGDFLGVVSAIGGIGYITLGKSLRPHVEVNLFMFLNMSFASCLIFLYMVASGQDVSFSRDIDIGIWGWTNLTPDRLPIEIATVVICNLLGTMGYVRAFQHFSSVIIAAAALLEPVAATFIAVLLQVGVFPGAMGWIGNLLVIAGTMGVIYPSIEE